MLTVNQLIQVVISFYNHNVFQKVGIYVIFWEYKINDNIFMAQISFQINDIYVIYLE